MLEIGRVVAVNPGDHSVDVLLLRTGHRLPGLQVLAQGASTDTGLSDLPSPTAPAGAARWSQLPARGARDVLAVVAPTEGNHVVLGFIFPQTNGVLSREPNRRVYRHASGAWHTIGPDGAVTIGHPSGATITMGANVEAPDPAGLSADGRWPAGGGANAGVKVSLPGGASFTMAPGGAVTIVSPGTVTVQAPTAHFTGDVTAAGDVTAGTISLRNHRHGGVETGGGTSGAAQV